MTWEPYDSRGRPNTPKSNPKDISLLSEPLRSRAHQMIVDCPYPGELGIVSGLRDPGTQWDLRDQRVGRANIWNASVKGTPTTAVPARWNPATGEWEGGSKHQTGKANDFGGTERAMQWMHANRERYGLARTVRSERWHQEADRVDVLTGRLHNNPTVTIHPFGGTNPPPLEDDMYTDEDRKRDEEVARNVASIKRGVDSLVKDYGTKGKGVRQVIVEIDKKTDDLVTGKRPEKG